MGWSTFFAILIAACVVGAIIADVRVQWRRRQEQLASMRRTGARRR